MTENKPILVIGDACEDRFIYLLSCDRLAPDGPYPICNEIAKTKNMGMAGNVYENIKSLFFPVKLICNSNYNEVTKTRYIEKKNNHKFVRIDSDDKIKRISNGKLENINFDKYSAVIISDYNKGYVEPDDIRYISERHPLTLLDSKKILGDYASKVAFIKINRKEYETSRKEIILHGLESKVIKTVGSEGCEYRGVIYPVEEVQVKEYSGLGDFFIAAFTIKYIKTKDIERSITFANKIATLSCQKRGGEKLTQEEINSINV